jgi:hypothetical protein
MGPARWGERHGAAADERAEGEGVGTNERPRCCVGRQADKVERVEIHFSVSDREMGPARADESH